VAIFDLDAEAASGAATSLGAEHGPACDVHDPPVARPLLKRLSNTSALSISS
jgi:hypothetical protein